MDYGYKQYRSTEWQPSPREHISIPRTDTSINQTHAPGLDLLNTPRGTAERSLSTAATMETLGIKIRPPGPALPTSSLYQRSRPAMDRTHSHPAYYGMNRSSQQQPVYWMPYSNDVLQHYSLPTTTGPAKDVASAAPVYAEYHPKISDEHLDISQLGPDLAFLQDNLSYSGGYQRTQSEALYPLASDSAFPADFHFPQPLTSGPPYVFKGSDTPPTSSASEVPGHSEAVSHPPAEYYTPKSSLTVSSATLSPIPSPRHTSDPIRPAKRPRTTPSPGLSKLPGPYAPDGHRARWSTGSGATSSTSRVPYSTTDYYQQNPPKKFRHPTPTLESANLPSTDFTNPPLLSSTPAMIYPHSHLLPSTGPSSDSVVHLYSPLPHGAFRTLHSNVDIGGHCVDHYANLSDPPDLLGPLQEEPANPPPEDMNPTDPDLTPHEQELRFENDLYTPRWVRGHGNKREGWCGICKPGRWLVLKNSAFWYDKSFTHGVSAATGQAFDQPKDTRRTEANADIWEGLCGTCGDWIPLVSSKKKGTTWFRHAYKCQSQPKNREGLKRRREGGHGNGRSQPPPAADR